MCAISCQGQDYLFNLAGQTSHLDSMTRPLHRSGDQLPGAARRSWRPAASTTRASRSSSPARGRSTASRTTLPVDEKHLLRPVDVNGINKMAGEWYHILYNNVYGIRALRPAPDQHLRPAHAGEGRAADLPGRLDPAAGRRKTVRGVGREPTPRLHLRGRCRRGAAAGRGRSRQPTAASSTSAATRRSAWRRWPICWSMSTAAAQYHRPRLPARPQTIDIGDYYADDRLLRPTLGWQPRVTLRDGLARTLAFYREHLPHYL